MLCCALFVGTSAWAKTEDGEAAAKSEPVSANEEELLNKILSKLPKVSGYIQTGYNYGDKNTAAGFTGFFGYFFGTALFANIGLGYVVQNLGWNWNFIVLLVACALAFIFIGFTAKEEQYLVKQAKQ